MHVQNLNNIKLPTCIYKPKEWKAAFMCIQNLKNRTQPACICKTKRIESRLLYIKLKEIESCLHVYIQNEEKVACIYMQNQKI